MDKNKKIQHLYWRAGFGLAPDRRFQKSKYTIQKAVKELLKGAKKINPVPVPEYTMPSAKQMKNMSRAEKQKRKKEIKRLTIEVNANWLRQMIGAREDVFREKMTLFWHGHFACESKRFDFAAKQINTIKKYALGNFRDLVVAISKDAAMLLYLNNQQNKKKKPNENYARELMELFTIGRGNYTEQDIKEAARAFTGWSANRMNGDFNFNGRQHDDGMKTFMGRTGKFDGDDIIDIILERKETAVYIATKVYRYFVHPQVNSKHVQLLADKFYATNYNIEAMMQLLLESDWFYDNQNIGAKIKSPIEFLVGFSNVLGLTFNSNKSILFAQAALGQVLFKPPNVAGWPGGNTWIDNSTLMLRLNFAAIAFQKAEVTIALKDKPEMEKGRRFKRLDVDADISTIKKAFSKPKNLPQEMADFLLQSSVKTKDTFIEEFGIAAVGEDDKFKAYLLGIMSLPEYQMC